MIIVRNLRKSFGSQVLFRDAELRVGARDRLALVGPNGSGKTTLLEMITGLQQPDAGQVELVSGAVLGYLPQETDSLRGRSILEEVLTARTDLAGTKHRLEVLEREIDQTADEEKQRLLDDYARLQGRFDDLGGYTIEAEARRICSGLGFTDADLERRTDWLSGGWLMRVALAKLLLAAPDVLLLDEPTNHLDLESVVWLERFLGSYEGAVLLISHDRDFMNGFATKVVELEDGELVAYTGNYEQFVEQRRIRAEQAAAAAKNQAKKVEHMETFIERFRYKASKARQVQSRIKALDKMERVQTPKAAKRGMKLSFPPPPRAGRVVVGLAGVTFGYDDTPVYSELDLEIERYDKVALVGPNGAGKTTLLKLLAGVLQPQAGERKLGHNVDLGYFAQHQIEALDPQNRVVSELQRAIPPGMNLRARDLLGRFLFSGDDIDKRVAVLSGGEQTRLAMAKLLVSPHNLLCLDEPTNHLDVQSRDVLEEALVDYQGAIVLITHDRHLIRSVANRIVQVDSGRVHSYPGDYESYLYRMQQAADSQPVEPDAAASRPDIVAPRSRSGASAKERRRQEADRRAQLSERRKALRRIESELDRVHQRVAELEAVLADPDFYTSGDGVSGKVREHAEGQRRVSQLEAEWERLAADLESDTLSS